jgi:hypothetical protein
MEDAIGIIKNRIAFRVSMEKKLYLLLTCSNLKNNHRVVSLMCLSALEKNFDENFSKNSSLEKMAGQPSIISGKLYWPQCMYYTPPLSKFLRYQKICMVFYLQKK